MDAGIRRRTVPERGRRTNPAGGHSGATRWGIQLAASAMLFLLVFIGRGVFPGQAFRIVG